VTQIVTVPPFLESLGSCGTIVIGKVVIQVKIIKTTTVLDGVRPTGVVVEARGADGARHVFSEKIEAGQDVQQVFASLVQKVEADAG